MFKYFIILLGLMTTVQSHAGLWSAITGHIEDVSSRFTSDKFIVENPGQQAIKIGRINEQAIGQDFLHNARGEIYILSHNNASYVQLSEDFHSSLGPDYHVYISRSRDINNEEDFHSSQQVELGKLSKGSGASYYTISGISPKDVGSVTIMCKEFDEYIGSANLNEKNY